MHINQFPELKIRDPLPI